MRISRADTGDTGRRGDGETVSALGARSNSSLLRMATAALLLSRYPVDSFQLPSKSSLRDFTRTSLHSSFYPSSGSDASVNGGGSAMPPSSFGGQQQQQRYYFETGRRGEFGEDRFPDRDFPYQDPFMEGGRRGGFNNMPPPPPPPPRPPMRNGVGGGYDPQAQKFFTDGGRRSMMGDRSGMYGEMPMSGDGRKMGAGPGMGGGRGGAYGPEAEKYFRRSMMGGLNGMYGQRPMPEGSRRMPMDGGRSGPYNPEAEKYFANGRRSMMGERNGMYGDMPMSEGNRRMGAGMGGGGDGPYDPAAEKYFANGRRFMMGGRNGMYGEMPMPEDDQRQMGMGGGGGSAAYDPAAEKYFASGRRSMMGDRSGMYGELPMQEDDRQMGMGVGGGGAYGPEAEKYFTNGRRSMMGDRNGMYGEMPMQMGMPGPGPYFDPPPPPRRPASTFANQRVGRSQRYIKKGKKQESVYDAEIYRDDEYYERVARLFPVLSRIQGIEWQGHIRYFDGDLEFSRQSNSRRQVTLRYDLEADGNVFLTISLGGRRIEMRGHRNGGDSSGRELPSDNNRYRQEGGSVPSYSQRGTIRLDPMNENDPNFMELVEVSPDTVLINEIDRFNGKVVLTASLSLANEDELVQVSHDVGEIEMPIESHQIWTLTRPGAKKRTAGSTRSSDRYSGTTSSSYSSSSSYTSSTTTENGMQRRAQVTTGIPQSITTSKSRDASNHRARSAAGNLGRVYPVLSKFAGITWEGDCRQINGDLGLGGAPRSLYGGNRYEIYQDGTVVWTTFLRTEGRVQSIEMRGGRVNGPGSPIRLDMDRGPNSMIITEVAPNTLLTNEVNRETGRIMFTACLFLANEDEIVQVSHQVSGRNPRNPIDLHQVWHLSPARDGYESESEWRDRDEYGGRVVDRSNDMRGGRSAWSRGSAMNGQAMYNNGSTNSGRRSINGLLTDPSRSPERRNGYGERDGLWLLNRSPEETRDRFRKTFNSWGGVDDFLYEEDFENDNMLSLRQDRLLDPELREEFPVLSQITGIDWKGTCRYVIGDTKPDSIMLLKGGMRYDLSQDGVCTMTTTLVLADGRTRDVRMRGCREPSKKYKYSNSMRLYPIDDEDDSVYTILTEISPDTILLNEVDSETDKVIYTASLSISNDRNELVQVTHELGDGIRMPVEGHQVWRMQRYGGTHEKMPGIRKPAGGWVPGSISATEELFPVLSKIEGAGWQGTFRFVNGDLERQLNFEATGKMWYDLNRNGTCVLTIVSSLSDGSSRYVQMRGERVRNAHEQIRLDPVDKDGTNYMLVTELPPDTVLLSEIDKYTDKLVSTASLSLYKDEVIQVSHEMGNRTRLDGHQIARLRRSKDRSSTSRGSMSYLLNGELQDYSYPGESLMELFPVLNQIDGINWQGLCKVIGGDMREQKSNTVLSGGMRYDLHRNGTCTMTSVLMHPDGRTHQIKLQGTRVGKSNKRSIRLDPVDGDSPFYTVLTEVPPDTILLNEVDKATNKVIFTASVSIASPDELIQISHDVDANSVNEDGHKIWRLKRSPVLGRNAGRGPTSTSSSYYRGQGFRGATSAATASPNSGRSGSDVSFRASPGGYDNSSFGKRRNFGTVDIPFGKPKPKDPNILFDF